MQATEPESRATRQQLRRRAAEIRDEQLQQALATLASGQESSASHSEQTDCGLTPEQRETVEAMSVAIVEGVLEPVESDLEQSPDDRRLSEAVRSLFDLEQP
jgi:glutamyl-tRNA reductase